MGCGTFWRGPGPVHMTEGRVWVLGEDLTAGAEDVNDDEDIKVREPDGGVTCGGPSIEGHSVVTGTPATTGKRGEEETIGDPEETAKNGEEIGAGEKYDAG